MSYDGLLLKIILVPLLGAALAARAKRPETARIWAGVATTLTLALACALVAHASSAGTPELLFELPIEGLSLGLASDGAVAVLATIVALVHLGALAFTPARTVDSRLGSALLLGEAGTMLGLHGRSPLLLLIGWALSTVPLLGGPVAASSSLARRAAAISIVSLTIAIGLDWMGGTGDWPSALPVASILWIVASLARLGAPPIHAWVPVGCERAPVALVVPALMCPLPLLALVHLMERSAPDGYTAWLLVVLGTCGALYGAVLAMVQNDLRRSIGYIQASFLSTLVAAVGTSTRAGAAGAILGVVAGTLAFSGLMFLASAISARTGTCDMRRLGGLHRSSPLGSAMFLLASVAIVGFPGTVGFVSEDLVMQGLVDGHPLATVAVLVAAALNAVTLFRSYERTYLGPASPHGRAPTEIEDLLPRERRTVMAWAALIVVGGFLPAPLMAIESALHASPAAHAGPIASADSSPRGRDASSSGR